MSEEFAVEVKNLSKTFYTGFFAPIPYLRQYPLGRLHKVVSAVSNLSFNIRSGEIFALLGANGAGKSTTMKMLMGLIKPTQGQAYFYDEAVHHAKARRNVGYLPENPSFYDELTPRELMHLFCALHHVPNREIEMHSDALITRVGMTHAADRPLRKLSKGMHQRIGIAQALIASPRLIVLDEPFSGLDPIGRREIREVLLEERARGASLLFSSHILPDVEALCDRFLILEQGQVRHQGSLADLSSSADQLEFTLVKPSEALQQDLRHLEGFTVLERGLEQKALFSFCIPESSQQTTLAKITEHQGHIYEILRLKPQLESLFVTSNSQVDQQSSKGEKADD